MINPVDPGYNQKIRLDKVDPFGEVNVRYERVSSSEPPASNQGSIYDVVEISSSGLSRMKDMAERPTVVKIKSGPARNKGPEPAERRDPDRTEKE